MPLRSAAALGISPSRRKSTCCVLARMGSRNSSSSTTKTSLRARIWPRISSFSRMTPWSSRESGRRKKEEGAMKRQLGLSLVVLAVLSVPPAWSQTGSDQSQNDSAGQSQNGSTGQSQNGSTDQSQNGSTDQSQNGSTDQSQNGSTDQSQQSSTGPQVAYTHPEQLPPLTLLNEVTANTGIRLNLGTGLLTGYNSPDTSHHGYWQTLGSFGTGLEITQIRPTLLWDLHYNGGLSLSALSFARSSNYTSLYQRAAVDILWQFSPRWQFSVHDN